MKDFKNFTVVFNVLHAVPDHGSDVAKPKAKGFIPNKVRKSIDNSESFSFWLKLLPKSLNKNKLEYLSVLCGI